MLADNDWTLRPVVNGDTVLNNGNCLDAAKKIMMLDEWGLWRDSFFEVDEVAGKTFSADEPFPSSSQLYLLLTNSNLFEESMLITYPPIRDGSLTAANIANQEIVENAAASCTTVVSVMGMDLAT